jgi:hypothetical protein
MDTHLTIKHLSPYLPYDLKVKTKIGNLILCQLNNCTKWEAWFYFEQESKNKKQIYNFKNLTNSHGIGRGFLLKEITPILRPLSDITKEIEVNGKTFVPFQLLREKGFHVSDEWIEEGINDSLNSAYEFVQLLIEWHFDVFGLIKKGLAIDINEL